MDNIYKVISVNDIVEWNSKGEIILSPKYQRNTVWNDKTRSYLIDTILRGLPMPPVFIRQTIDVAARITYREVLDGQQRLRTIIDYVNGSFPVMRRHNPDFGGRVFDELPDEIKEAVLEYSLFAVIVNEKDDNVVYDMFARLNTNNYVLNRQEIRNAKYWGEFKTAIYDLASEYRPFFDAYSIFRDKGFSRMEDVEFISSLMNYILNGIVDETPASIDRLYSVNNSTFGQADSALPDFHNTMDFLKTVFGHLYSNTFFAAKVPFYTLFVVAHMFLHASSDQKPVNENRCALFANAVNGFNDEYNDCILNKNIDNPLSPDLLEFERLHRTRTTSRIERTRRVAILHSYITNHAVF